MTRQINGSANQTRLVDGLVELTRSHKRFGCCLQFDEETGGSRHVDLANNVAVEPQTIASVLLLLLARADEERHLFHVVQVIDNVTVLRLTPAQLGLGRT